MLSLIIFVKDYTLLKQTLVSLYTAEECCEIFLLSDSSDSNLLLSEAFFDQIETQTYNKIKICDSESLEKQLLKTTGEYICVTYSGTVFGKYFFSSVLPYLKSVNRKYAYFAFSKLMSAENSMEALKKYNYCSVDLEKMPQYAPITNQTVIFERKILEDLNLPSQITNNQEIFLLYQLLLKVPEYMLIHSAYIQDYISAPQSEDNYLQNGVAQQTKVPISRK